jgi:hypothetical protein
LWEAPSDLLERHFHPLSVAAAEDPGAVCEAAEVDFFSAKAGVSIGERESAMRARRRSSVDTLDTSGALHDCNDAFFYGDHRNTSKPIIRKCGIIDRRGWMGPDGGPGYNHGKIF